MDGTEPDNIAEIIKETYKLSEYKNILIRFLNKNPLINYKQLSFKAKKIFSYYKFYIVLKKIHLKMFIIIGRGLITNNIFKWYMIFDNNLTIDQKPFLRSFYKGYIYDENSNKLFLHTHALFISKLY